MGRSASAHPSLNTHISFPIFRKGSRSEDVILNELDSHEGAKRGALFYSLSCSCRLCGVDFFEYLTDVINRIAAMGPKATADTCRDLLPDKWEKKL